MTITVLISFLFHLFILVLLMFFNTFIKTDASRIRPPAASIEVNLVKTSAEKPAKKRVEPVKVNKQQVQKPAEEKSKPEVKIKEPEKKAVTAEKPKVKEIPKVAEKPKVVEKSRHVIPEPAVQQKAPTQAKAPEIEEEIPEKIQESVASAVLDREKAAEAQVAKLTSETAPVSGPEVDIPDFKYDYYLGLIRGKVDSRWSQPITYKAVKQTLIEFVVNRDGEINRIVIAESSGDIYFDQSALRAVILSNPLPPLPRGYREGFLKVRYRFIFGDTG